MTQLTWNNTTGNYEARDEEGHLIEVDGDTFAECRWQRAVSLIGEKYPDYSKQEATDRYSAGKEDWAYDQATEELLDILPWTFSTPMDGVFVDGVAQF